MKIALRRQQLVGIERYSAEKPEGPGRRSGSTARSSELSRAAVTVQGEAVSLTCVPPAALLEKILARFAVGDSVKMMCRGSELTYLEKV